MRLADFSVAESTTLDNTYTVAIRVAYGDSDLLCDTTLDGSDHGCEHNDAPFAASANVYGGTIQCRVQTGSQFCSVSGLKTTVQMRTR
jgi:hypothetical protein